MKPAIRVDHLSKRYRLGATLAGGYQTLRETLAHTIGAPFRRLKRKAVGSPPGGDRTDTRETLWALKDVSLEIEQGDVVGLIGRNGAGKSTLLKVLSRITEPTEGRAELRGRVGSLLEVGTGFHMELTGRENIFLNGAIRGMSRREIMNKFDDIVEFSEVEQFLDTPVKRYSSGMFVRLAFAVASHMEPEILLVDEVLAVGDVAFQKKCLGKMSEVHRSGRTIIFVSHNMATILNLCEKVAVFDHGRVIFFGDCEEGVDLYNKALRPGKGCEIDLADHPNRRRGSHVILHRLRLLNGHGEVTDQHVCGEPLTIEVELEPTAHNEFNHVAVGFEDSFGVRLFTAATYLTAPMPSLTDPKRRYVCQIDQLPLTPGHYSITLEANMRGRPQADVIDQALGLDVLPTDYYGNGRLPHPNWGRFLIKSHWEMEGE